MKIAFLPTGRTEWHGLPEAFNRLFPAHDFYTLPTELELRSHPDDYPYPGFTSTPLREGHEVSPPEAARDLLERAAQAALGDRYQDPADLVIVLDDLEQANAGKSELVARIFRAAASQHLGRLGPGGVQVRTARALRERVSFHIVAPMIEAIFFADPRSLTIAGVPTGAPIVFSSECDPEEFLTTDPAYLAASAADCPCWSALPVGRQKKLRPKWLGSGRRERHPKGYVQWLCRAADNSNCTTYNETSGGGPALAALGWPVVLSRPDGQLQHLRSIIADIEDALGQPPTTGPVTGAQAPATSRFDLPRAPVLRNM